MTRADGSSPAPSILHVDMDAFFASVEIHDDPTLAGRPVVVGGTGPRGVVAAASYEARASGVFSAQPMAIARRRCPGAVVLPPRMERYREVSDTVMAIFDEITPLVEPLSLDEAFLDVTGRRRSLGDGPHIGRTIRRRVSEATGLTASVGVAPNKFLAKLATEQAKPTATAGGPRPGLGVKVVTEQEVTAFLDPLPIRALWGVGPATGARLSAIGVETVGDLSRLPLAAVTAAVGEHHGAHLWDLSHGRDDRVVTPDSRARSVSHEETFAADVVDVARLRDEVLRQADSVAYRLRRAGLVARTVTLKLRDPEFRTITRSRTLEQATDDGLVLAGVARELLAGEAVHRGVRLIGVGASGLGAPGFEATQLSLADAVSDEPGRRRVINDTVDGIRERFGVTSIGAATLARPGRPLDDVADPDRTWGPRSDPAAPRDRSGG